MVALVRALGMWPIFSASTNRRLSVDGCSLSGCDVQLPRRRMQMVFHALLLLHVCFFCCTKTAFGVSISCLHMHISTEAQTRTYHELISTITAYIHIILINMEVEYGAWRVFKSSGSPSFGCLVYKGSGSAVVIVACHCTEHPSLVFAEDCDTAKISNLSYLALY